MKKLLTVLVMLFVLSSTAFAAGEAPLIRAQEVVSAAAVGDSLEPVVQETGKVSLSVDALGMRSSSGTIQVDKPAGATVKAAYLAAASTGFTGYTIPNGGVTLNGVAVDWDVVISSSISSKNHWADVTSHVKSAIDAAPAGIVDITVGESSESYIDGTILAVIFNDPNVDTQTVVLLFGAQNIAGDEFSIGLAEPVDKSTNPQLDMSLGISYGAQGSSQYSIIDVNGARLTTSAGGEDDGAESNGALITAGGIGDSNDNPANPNAFPVNERSDDELYNLVPFVENGDTLITVSTRNPSNDDNILFGAFVLSTAAVVGEGILLAPIDDLNPVGDRHTVTATVQDDNGQPIEGRLVSFEIISGPHAGYMGSATTDSKGMAQWTYTGVDVGIDTIIATVESSQQTTLMSNQVTKEWYKDDVPPTNDIPEFGVLGALAVLGLAGVYVMRRRN